MIIKLSLKLSVGINSKIRCRDGIISVYRYDVEAARGFV
jgi:hypothetical protein